MTPHRRILLITFPAQGHINPALQFAKNLIRIGVEVTFLTTLFVQRRMEKAGRVTQGLSITSFSDGFDDGPPLLNPHYVSELRKIASENLKKIVHSSSLEGRSISCVVYSLLVEWVAEVARGMQVPSALLWIQPASVMDIYYYYFNGYEESMSNCNNEPSWSIKLPGLPLLHAGDLPTFVHDKNFRFILKTVKEQVEAVVDDEKTKPCVLVNTFDSLEFEALRAIDRLKLRAIGPLIPTAFLEGKDPSEVSHSGDLFQISINCKEWLDSKPHKSVVYVSFGSMLNLPEAQMEEIARGLLKCGMPFLWVIKKQEDKDKLTCIKELEERGMIVPWCSQLEVLSHPALGCFLTHCGWNSTLESLVSGVPVVAFPQWTDQTTNAKLIEDVWKTGVRVKGNNGVVDGDEVHRCLELVMKGEELGRNAKEWSDLAREAISEGGSSDKNLKAFVAELGSVI